MTSNPCFPKLTYSVSADVSVNTRWFAVSRRSGSITTRSGFGPATSLVVSCGFSGALDPWLRVGDLVLASSVTDELGDTIAAPADVLALAHRMLGGRSRPAPDAVAVARKAADLLPPEKDALFGPSLLGGLAEIQAHTGGTAVVHADRTFDFTPDAAFTGAASFSFTVTNGFGTSSAAWRRLLAPAPADDALTTC